MAQPDKTKKKVSQIGYDDSNVKPFVDNYKELYTKTLTRAGKLFQELKKYTDAARFIEDDSILATEIRYLYEATKIDMGEDDE